MTTFNNSQLQSFFTRGTYAQAHSPANDAHAAAVDGFFNWMAQNQPDVYNKVIARRPDLAQGVVIVNKGAMAAKAPKLKGLADMYSDQSTADVSYEPATSWGNDLMSTINQVLPTYFNAQITQNAIDLQKQQNQALMTYNIQRAEQGLQPVNTLQGGTQLSGGTLALIAIAAYAILKH